MIFIDDLSHRWIRIIAHFSFLYKLIYSYDLYIINNLVKSSSIKTSLAHTFHNLAINISFYNLSINNTTTNTTTGCNRFAPRKDSPRYSIATWSTTLTPLATPGNTMEPIWTWDSLWKVCCRCRYRCRCCCCCCCCCGDWWGCCWGWGDFR